jgi:hypothetical protein
MPRAGVFHATGVVKNDHQGCKMALERMFDYKNASRPEKSRGGACLQRSLSDRAKQSLRQAETQGNCETTETGA